MKTNNRKILQNPKIKSEQSNQTYKRDIWDFPVYIFPLKIDQTFHNTDFGTAQYLVSLDNSFFVDNYRTFYC